MKTDIKTWLLAGIALAALTVGYLLWQSGRESGPGEGFVSGNGRIEATEINLAAKVPGRVQEVLVREGDFVKAGQPLVTLKVDTLDAQRNEALARQQQAITGVSTARAQVAQLQSNVAAARANVTKAESDLDAARRRLARSQALAREGAVAAQQLDDDRAAVRGAQAAVDALRAQAVAAEAAVEAARAQVTGAESAVKAADATVARIDADIADSTLVAPRAARVQYRIAQPGEVLGAGAPALNLIDLGDVYMSFFIPETVAGRVALGSEVRIVLDAAPHYPIPAQVSFVASQAQFTPKTVETASERQKLMFRVRAQIPRELLERHIEQIKTGLPGVAWIKLDAGAQWPPALSVKSLPAASSEPASAPAASHAAN